MEDADLADVIRKAVSLVTKGVLITADDLKLCRKHSNREKMIRLIRREGTDKTYGHARRIAEQMSEMMINGER